MTLGDSCDSPVTPLLNDKMPSMSVTLSFSSLSKHYAPANPAVALPTPPGASKGCQYTACQDSSQPSAIHRGTFTAPLAVPSQHQRQRDGVGVVLKT